MSFLFLLSTAVAVPPDAIVVTAAREPVAAAQAPVSVSLFERREIEALGLPMAADLVRLVPAASVAATGPRGTQTQVRIRGAEANHTLLFVDGIRFNDPAAGNEARFELLAAEALSRLEVVRGPQSALWGSEAIGGVIAAAIADPLAAPSFRALGEYGSLGSHRLAAQATARSGPIGLSAAAGWLRSDGIDSFGAPNGDRDGFDNRSASLKAVFAPAQEAEIGLVGHWIEGRSDYDGFDPVTFRRADTRDATDNRLWAVRGWAAAGAGDWRLRIDGSLLDSANRNRLGDAPLNSSFGRRFTAGAQASRDFAGHSLTAAAEYQGENFRARDTQYFGGTDQDRSREAAALIGQWRANWTQGFTTDVAVRRDHFSDFADATTVRAAALVRPFTGWTVHAAYGEGIAQPTFYDLHGFFPGSFVGNPDLRPERSRGFEAGLRWEGAAAAIGVTGFTQRLRDEIVDTFEPATFLSSTANAEGRSRRRGLEVEGRWRALQGLNLGFNYTFLDAREQQAAAARPTRELRRPRHSANLFADGALGGLRWGASLAYVGRREDMDFDLWPAPRVRLDDYVLASLQLAWAVTPALEAFGRVENALDGDYQDVVGYNTAGRTVHAGLRLRLGR
ncbi:MAG: TonB-dependent receptor plug domain-containing protein [Allosphingosinicella sp.]|uniref:TonB-dependent receptor plug domain-containing protein n=1 Tax=Allosphingosinicella sp. TaxID=2823234 RepID=UPI00395A4634